jgi:hypothetical protein
VGFSNSVFPLCPEIINTLLHCYRVAPLNSGLPFQKKSLCSARSAVEVRPHRHWWRGRGISANGGAADIGVLLASAMLDKLSS